MVHAQKSDFFFRRNGRVHLNRRGRQFSRLLAAEMCASAVVMLDTPCFEVVGRALATHTIRQFPLTITFQLDTRFNIQLLSTVPIACIVVLRLILRMPRFFPNHRLTKRHFNTGVECFVGGKGTIVFFYTRNFCLLS